MIRADLYIDVGPLLEDQWTGIPVFTRRLVRAAQASGRLKMRYCFELHDVPPDLVDRAVAMGAGTHLRGALFSEGTTLSLCDMGVPLLYPSAKHIALDRGRSASTVHDLSTLFMPENHEPSNVSYHLEHFREELETDEVVFCVSEATENALTTAFPSVSAKTKVMYQYVDWPNTFEAAHRNAPSIAIGPYAVVIGTLEPRKNLGVLLKALSDRRLEQLGLKFLVIGKKGWKIDQFLEEISPDQRQRLIFTGFVSEFVKYRLLSSSLFLIFPSVYEGFGIPAVEALSLGKPVIAAMTSCLPEVIGEAGLYFDPYDAVQLVDAIEYILGTGHLESFRAQAIERSRYFTPERMIAPVLDWLG